MLQASSPEVFLDTDVAFDIISKREPFYTSSIQVLQLTAQGTVQLLISENSLATLFYLSFDIYKIKDAALRLIDFISTCELVCGGKDVAVKALQSELKDKEDALQYYTAINAKAKYFITRNIKDYKQKDASVSVYTPAEFMKEFEAGENS